MSDFSPIMKICRQCAGFYDFDPTWNNNEITEWEDEYGALLVLEEQCLQCRYFRANSDNGK